MASTKTEKTSPDLADTNRQLTAIMYVDKELVPQFDESPQVMSCFDDEGLFKIPPGLSASSWLDAQQLAAQSIDQKDSLIRELSLCVGPPRLWNASLIKIAQEVHELAETAVLAGALGVLPSARRWESVDRHGALQYRFSDCINIARLNASGSVPTGVLIPEAFRARLAYLCNAGCLAMIRSNVVSEYRQKTPDDLDAMPPHVVLPPYFVIQQVQALRDTANFLANAGQEKRRPKEKQYDNFMRRVAAVANYLANEVTIANGIDESSLPAMMRTHAHGGQLNDYKQIADSIDGMGSVSLEERSGAALLLCLVKYGWGPKNIGSNCQQLLSSVRANVRPTDEELGGVFRRYPVLRWRKIINNGLNALGHTADDLCDGAVRSAKKIANDAHRKLRSNKK